MLLNFYYKICCLSFCFSLD